MKDGGSPTLLLAYAKMLLVRITFFPFCWVDYALDQVLVKPLVSH